MSWITIIWSAISGICLTLAGVHFLVWLKSRGLWANLLFSIAAASAAVCAGFELALMHSQTPAEFGEALRWLHVPIALTVVSLIWFVRRYLQAGRLWMVWLFCSLRVVTLTLTFSLDPNLNFREITGLRPILTWGETIVFPIGVQNPWINISHASGILFLVFVVDAAIAAWRKGNRQRAVVVGATFGMGAFASTSLTSLVERGFAFTPFTISLAFLIIVLGMAYELSMDLLNANRLAFRLRENQERMDLAAKAAGLGLWEWDVVRDEVWANEITRGHIGAGESEPITLIRFLESLYPNDREPTHELVRQALEDGRDYQAEYRTVTPEGAIRWIVSSGQVERSPTGKPHLLRGVSMDITQRKQAESERIQLRNDLAHAQRVSTLGHISSALAHELNQPLGAILNNASAAQILRSQTDGDNTEIGEILADIISDTRRAGQVVRKIRGIVKKTEVKFEPLNVNVLIEEAVALYRNTFNLEKISTYLDLQPDLLPVSGDRIHLQQVLMNLINNACEAMEKNSPKALKIRSTMQSPDRVIVSVIDSGTGIDEAEQEKVFDQFFSTKKEGLGLGLGICRSIIEEHGGRIWVENNPAGGAIFLFSLKTCQGDCE